MAVWNKGINEKLKTFNCKFCNKEYCAYIYTRTGKYRQYCSRECWKNDPDKIKPKSNTGPHPHGENHGSWKGGKYQERGYIRVSAGPNRYILEHRLVMEKYLGRKLYPDETVHHINGNKADNRIENLELWSSNHPKGQRVENMIEWAREIIGRYERVELLKKVGIEVEQLCG